MTHFCAPAFVLLAGTSAFLYGERLADKGALSWLLSRGAWIVLLELTVVRVCWTFNLEVGRYMLAGVLWMIGWRLILMTPLIRLPIRAIGALGLAIVAGDNLTAFAPAESVQEMLEGPLGGLWKVLYFGGAVALGGADSPDFLVLYSLIPWIGVMATGYAFGALLRQEEQPRRRACLAIGLSAIALFLVLGSFNLYGDRPWHASEAMPGWLAFMNTTKYPASLLFLLMTLGPMIAILPWLEGATGRVAEWLRVFGRIPFAYYLLHVPFIHSVALLISLVRTPQATSWLFQDHPMNPGLAPEGYMWSLALLYSVTALLVIALYFPLPLVRGAEGATQGLVVELPLNVVARGDVQRIELSRGNPSEDPNGARRLRGGASVRGLGRNQSGTQGAGAQGGNRVFQEHGGP